MSQRQYDRWQNRWQGLRESIEAQIQEIAGDNAPILKRPAVAADATPAQILGARGVELEEAKAFAQTILDSSDTQQDKHFKAAVYLALNLLLRYTDERFNYFVDGFYNKEAKHPLEQSIELPPAYILQRTLTLAARDFSRITRIYVQRQNAEWRDHLESADYLANLALEPAIKAKLVPDAQIITYFQKETSVQIIPYASLALIGIPYASLHNPADLMSIPHEVGHHVYVNGKYRETDDGPKKILSQELARQVAEYPYWLRQWTEEIFADVYGAIIAGPIAALTAQTLIDEKSPAERVQDDGEHPVDIVRPLVYQYILDKIHSDTRGSESTAADAANRNSTQQLIDALEARWKNVNFGLPKQFRPAAGPLGLNEQSPDDFIKEEEAAQMLKDLIMSSENILQLKQLLIEGEKGRQGAKQPIDRPDGATDPEIDFPFGNWGNIKRTQLQSDGAVPEEEQAQIDEPEVMFDNFSALFRGKFKMGSLGLGIQSEVDSQKEAALQFDVIRKEEPYSTHILYGFDHGAEVQIPAGVWRLLGDDWGEKGPKTLSGGGGGGYP